MKKVSRAQRPRRLAPLGRELAGVTGGSGSNTVFVVSDASTQVAGGMSGGSGGFGASGEPNGTS